MRVAGGEVVEMVRMRGTGGERTGERRMAMSRRRRKKRKKRRREKSW